MRVRRDIEGSFWINVPLKYAAGLWKIEFNKIYMYNFLHGVDGFPRDFNSATDELEISSVKILLQPDWILPQHKMQWHKEKNRQGVTQLDIEVPREFPGGLQIRVESVFDHLEAEPQFFHSMAEVL